MKKYLYLLLLVHGTSFAYTNEDVLCLATTIYKEAANQSTAGQIAVGAVVINRVGHEAFPSTLCAVVKQRNAFSWYKGGKVGKYANRKDSRYGNAVIIAYGLLSAKEFNVPYSNVGDALYFHSTSVNPNWRGVKRVKKIGDHVFYKQTSK